MNIITKIRGGHKFLAYDFTMKRLKEVIRYWKLRPTIPQLRSIADACLPSEIELDNLLFTEKGPYPLKEPNNQGMAAYHALWYLLPFVRKHKANTIADLMKLLEKCIPDDKALHGTIAWWKRRK